MYYRNYYYPQYYSEADLETAFALGYKDASAEMYYYTPQYTDDFLYEAYLMGKQAARDDEESALRAMARGAGSLLVPGAATAGGGALAAHLIKAPDLSEEAIRQAARDKALKAEIAFRNLENPGQKYYYDKDKVRQPVYGANIDQIAEDRELAKHYGITGNDFNELEQAYRALKAQDVPKHERILYQQILNKHKENILKQNRAYEDAVTKDRRLREDINLRREVNPNAPDLDTIRIREALAEAGIKPGVMTNIKRLVGSGTGIGLNNIFNTYDATSIDPTAIEQIERGGRRLQAAGRIGGIAASAIGSGLLAKGIYDRMVG